MRRIRERYGLRYHPVIVSMFTACTAATAQLTPILPFQGELSEDFESHCPCPSSFFCIMGGIFRGEAELCADQGYVALESRGLCDLLPHSGRVLYGITGRPIEGATIGLREPITRFGGRFAQVHESPGGISIAFFDGFGELIGRDVVNFTGDCTWRWAGWESTIPIAKIHILGFRTQGPFSVTDEFNMDDLQASFAPTQCYPDCDTSTGPGILDIFDFLCFGNRFAAGDPYACDCDVSTGPGLCDIFDFLCFGNEFSAGCL